MGRLNYFVMTTIMPVHTLLLYRAQRKVMLVKVVSYRSYIDKILPRTVDYVQVYLKRLY